MVDNRDLSKLREDIDKLKLITTKLEVEMEMVNPTELLKFQALVSQAIENIEKSCEDLNKKIDKFKGYTYDELDKLKTRQLIWTGGLGVVMFLLGLFGPKIIASL